MQDKYPASTREEAPLTSVLVRPGSHLSSSLASGLSSRLTGPAGRVGVFCGVLKLTLMTNILNERISHFFLKNLIFFAFLENSEFSGGIEPAFPAAVSAVD